MKRSLAILFVLAIGLNACNETVAEYDKTLPAVQSDSAQTLSSDSATTNVVLPQNNSTQPQDVQPSTALNPAHGQPGHRCDIEVGAPLNSARTISPVIPTIPPIQPATPVLPTSTGGAVTLNPPHGQPGHDCAVPVGQPLKS